MSAEEKGERRAIAFQPLESFTPSWFDVFH